MAQSLVGTVLIAPPQLKDDFAKSLIVICGHDNNGAVGITINKTIPSLYLDDLLEQLDISMHDSFPKRVPIFAGGESDMGRGFVLHSNDYWHEQTIPVTETISLTATLDVLNKIGGGKSPSKNLLALGYVNWEKGELEKELRQDKWLWTTCTDELVFNFNEDKWQTLIDRLSLGSGHISAEGGRC